MFVFMETRGVVFTETIVQFENQEKIVKLMSSQKTVKCNCAEVAIV